MMEFYCWDFELEYLNDPVRRKESFIARSTAQAWILAGEFVGRCGGTPVIGLHHVGQRPVSIFPKESGISS